MKNIKSLKYGFELKLVIIFSILIHVPKLIFNIDLFSLKDESYIILLTELLTVVILLIGDKK